MEQRKLSLVIVLHTAIFVLISSAAPVEKKENVNKTESVDTSILNSIPVSDLPEVPYIASAVLKNCTLLPVDDAIIYKIKSRLDEGAKLLKFHLSIDKADREFTDRNSSLMYKPYFWARSTGRHGTGLLLLRPEYDILSLTTLELGVYSFNVSLKEYPAYCLSSLSYPEIEHLTRELVMNDFQNTSGDLVKFGPTDNVCNIHIRDSDGTAEFQYLCCTRDDKHVITCKYLETDIWLNILLAVIVMLKVYVILFSPRFVPDSFYRQKHIAAPYVYKLPPDTPFKLRTVLTKFPEKYKNFTNRIKLSKFQYMSLFKSQIQNMRADVPYAFSLENILLSIKSNRLLNEKYAPVGIFETLYDSFVKCKIRERSSVAACCRADVCIKSTCRKSCTWYRVFKEVMKLVVLVVLVTPWLIRMYVYFKYEDGEMASRKVAAKEKNLRFYFPGSFTLLLTPLHVLFIIIYVVLSLESCIFGVVSKRSKEKFKMVLRACFRDMREKRKMEVVGWVVYLLIKPCTAFGGLGICIGLVLWVFLLPFLSVILAFYLFPTLNVTIRLLAHFIVYMVPKNICTSNRLLRVFSGYMSNIEKRLEMGNISANEKLEKNDSVLNSFWGRFQQLLVIFMCLISLYSVIFLITEFLSFIVEIFVYTLMGLILNAGTTMTYISLSLLLGVYGIDCFGTVTKRFLAFNATMNGVILGLGKSKVEEVVYQPEFLQKNEAFIINTDKNSKISRPVKLIKSIEGLPRWKFSRLLLFLSKYDEPLIPKTFYFNACRMKFYAVPGELLLGYMRAAVEFGAIVLFLVFVLIVVLAFGDTYELSATNKLLATIAGGFLPFMLRNIVFKAHTVPNVDTNCIPFQVCLKDEIETYEQSWPIFDIEVKSRQILLGKTAGDVSDKVENRDNDEIDNRHVYNVYETQIDLLIDIKEIDFDEFPNMLSEKHSSNRDIGSTSFLDDDFLPDEELICNSG